MPTRSKGNGTPFRLTSSSKPIRTYYQSLRQYSLLHATHEGAVSEAFGTLLNQCARQIDCTLVQQYELRRPKRPSLRVDGAIVNTWALPHGYWEAKDTRDDLDAAARAKIEIGYPTGNTIFQSPDRILLYQNGKRVFDQDITDPDVLTEALRAFFRYRPPAIEEWELAVEEFRAAVPRLGQTLLSLIEKERRANPIFESAFTDFVAVCRRSLNPNLPEVAVENTLAQHILTERLFRKVFDNPDFTRRNVVALEIEKVVDALTKRHFNRDRFLAGLDRFYIIIEKTAASLDDFSEKQNFLNTIYENFFKGFDQKTADTHGIVYTPQPIVKFIVSSADSILKQHFHRSLSDQNVHILDPFVGTGNFIVRTMRHIPKTRLIRKYHDELHANEVMLLPYYVASMNIEHEFAELTGEYQPFEGLCLVDTFELAEPKCEQLSFISERNTQRVERQRKSPITVVIGNPPYNANQVNENDNNKNRKYETMDRRVAETYAASSDARLLSKLGDPYIKAIRWASDRIGEEGLVALVTNNSYISHLSLDGVRRNLRADFDSLYIVNLGGDVRINPRLSGTVHNVFGIQNGVSIGFFVRLPSKTGKRSGTIYYAEVDDSWRAEERLKFLENAASIDGIKWKILAPDEHETWLTEGLDGDFDRHIPLNSDRGDAAIAVFSEMSLGVSTNRDNVVYDDDRASLARRVRRFAVDYNAELKRYQSTESVSDLDAFLDTSRIKWSWNLKRDLAQGKEFRYDERKIVEAMYRPFTRRFLYLAEIAVDRPGASSRFFPAGHQNMVIAVSGRGSRCEFSALVVDRVADLHLASSDGFQLFALYTYSDDGTRRENITDSALFQFRLHYGNKSISKIDIFYYTYAVLQHPEYRRKYAANLRRDLPRLPKAADFFSFRDAGKRLANLHLNYHLLSEWPLGRIENPKAPLNLRVEKMKLSADRSRLIFNGFLTLTGIPQETFEYRLGNRSVLEWLIDQYQVSTDKRTGIVRDPNRRDDAEFVLRLIGQVVRVSVETVKLVRTLPALTIDRAPPRRAEPARAKKRGAKLDG